MTYSVNPALARALIYSVIGLHVVWILAVIVSIPLAFMFPGIRYIYFGLIAVTALNGVLFKGCLITAWENRLRRAAGIGGEYNNSCITHYLKQWWNISFPRPAVRMIILGALIISIILIFI